MFNVSHNTRKAKKLHEKGGANPMPSLIFHEGKLDENPTPEKNDTLGRPPEIFKAVTPITDSLAARRLMWFAVIFLTLVICGLWAWSISNQFYNIEWSATPEKKFMDDLRTNWSESFNEK